MREVHSVIDEGLFCGSFPQAQPETCHGGGCMAGTAGTAGAGFVQYRNLLQKKASLFDDFCQGKTGLFAAPADADGNVDCQGYYNCFHGNEAMQLCGSGRRFNPATKNCDWKRNVACDSVQTTTLAPGTTTQAATTQSSVSSSPSTSSPTDPSEFCSGKVGLYAAPVDMAGNEDCRGYFNCFHGNEPMQLCVPGQRFNPDLKNCDWSVNVECVTAPTTAGITTTATESSSSTTVSTSMGTTSTSAVEATSTTLATTQPSGTSGKIFVAYFANWFQWWPAPYKFMPSNIAADKITHLNYAFAMIHSSTFKIRHFEDNDVSNWGTGNWEVPCSQQPAGCTKGLYEQVNDLKAQICPKPKAFLKISEVEADIWGALCALRWRTRTSRR